MDALITSFFAHYPVAGTIVAVIVAAHALAVAVVNLTPTPTDNKVVTILYTVIEYVAGLIHPNAKQSSIPPATPPVVVAAKPVAAPPAPVQDASPSHADTDTGDATK